MPEPRLGIVVVNYGSHALLDKHLARLDAALIPARIVVVDNYSSAAELQAVTAVADRSGWELISSPRNLGFGLACNLGAARAAELGCDVFVMLNPDAIIGETAAAQLADLARRHPRSLISPIIRRPDGSHWFRGSRLDARSGAVGSVTGPFTSGPNCWLTGACLVSSASLWSELGGFADDYFLYWEDLDLSRRCVELGGSLVLADDIVAVHDVGGTQTDDPATGTSGSPKSATYYYFNTRNRLLFGSRHLPTRQLLGWIVRTPAQSAAILLRGGRRQFLSNPRLLLAGVRGTVVGLGIAVRELVGRGFRRLRPRAARAGTPLSSEKSHAS